MKASCWLALGSLLCLGSGLKAIEGAAYLKPAEGVRSVGLGGAATALPGSPESLWFNPGALADLQGLEASFTHNSWSGGMDSDHVLVAGTLNWRHQLGLLYHKNSVQDVYRDSFGKESGGFEVSSTVLGGVYAYSAEYFTLGVGAKQLSEVVEKASASSLVYDAGILSELASDEILLGIAVQNIGQAPQVSAGGTVPAVEAPLTLRSGAGLRFSGDFNALLLLVDYKYLLVSQRSDFAFGLEYSERFEGARLGLRGGYDLSRAQLGGLAGLGLGAGLGYGPATLDYAYAPQEVLGATHRLSLSLLWDLKTKGREQELSNLYGSTPPTPAAAVRSAPSPKPTPSFRVKAAAEGAGADLDALLAATPTALPSPTPVVEVRKEKARGLLGGLFNLFNFGSKKGGEEEVEGEANKEKPSVLKSVFRFLGFSSSSSPSGIDDIEKEKEDAVAGTPAPTVQAGPTPVPTPTLEAIRRLKGDGAVAPTPQPTAVLDKVKNMFKLGEEN